MADKKKKLITKKLGDEIFAWDTGAWRGKGYWFTLGTQGGLGRAASTKEAKKLGKPPPEESESVKKPMEYKTADKLKKKKLTDLISEKLVEGDGIGKAIGGSISEKVRGFGTRVKKTFDPMNMAKGLMGNFGASMYGKMMGRSQEDMEYFTGMKGKKKKTAEAINPRSRTGNLDFALHTKVSEGEDVKVAKGDSISDVLAKLYNLIKTNNTKEAKEDEIHRNFLKEQKKEKDDLHKRLLEAITGLKKSGKGLTAEKVVEGDKSWLSSIMEWLGEWAGLKAIFDILKSFGTGILGTIAKFGGLLGSFLVSPLFSLLIGLLAEGALAAWLAGKFSDWVKENKVNFKTGLTAKEAASVLENGNAADIEKMGGKEHLEEIVNGGADRARKILASGDSAAIRNAGGRGQLEKIIKDEETGGRVNLPANRASDEPDTPIPRPTGTGAKAKAAATRWDSNWQGIRDPNTGLLLKKESTSPGSTSSSSAAPAAASTSTPSESPAASTGTIPSTATPAGEGGNDLGNRAQAAIKENNEAKLDEQVSSGTPTILTNNSVSGSQGKSESGMVGKATVRNEESSFQRALGMIARPV